MRLITDLRSIKYGRISMLNKGYQASWASQFLYYRPKSHTILQRRMISIFNGQKSFQKDTDTDQADRLEDEGILQLDWSMFFEKSRKSNAYSDYGSTNYEFTTENRYALEEEILQSEKTFESYFSLSSSEPEVGSIIEFYDFEKTKMNLGIVLSRPEAIFNESYNKITVLSLTNEIIKVAPFNVSLHLPRILTSELSFYREILINGNFSDLGARLILLDFLRVFKDKSNVFLEQLDAEEKPQFEIAFSQIASPSEIKNISIIDLYNRFDLSEPQRHYIEKNNYSKATFILACHLALTKDPHMWMVPSSCGMNTASNLILKQHSNQVIRGSLYFCNSIINKNATSRLLGECSDPTRAKELRGLLLKIIDDLALNDANYNSSFFFTLWDGEKYLYIINTLKYFVIYPHERIRQTLEKILSLEGRITPKSIFTLLKKLKIYDNQSNPSTDIYLSANIAGNIKLHQLSASSYSDLSNEPTFIEGKTNVHSDMFMHLRNPNRYDENNVLYGLPYNISIGSQSMTSVVAVSLQESDSNKSKINVHIPDVITRVPPSSELFHAISKNSPYNSLFSKIVNQGMKPNLKALNSLLLTNQNCEKNNKPFLVGNIVQGENKIPNLKSTCMTLSFEYDKYSLNPFENIESKISFSFDDISRAKIKVLQWDDLQKALSIRKDLQKFFLFSQPNTKSISYLTDRDVHNLSYIFSVLKGHHKMRNMEGSCDTDPASQIKLETSDFFTKSVKVFQDSKENLIALTNFVRPSMNRVELFHNALFFIKEVEKFVSGLTSIYCSKYDIPVIRSKQTTLAKTRLHNIPYQIKNNSDKPRDEISVSHNNSLLPDFNANSYEHVLLSRGASGFLSLSAHLVGLNFLGEGVKNANKEEPTILLRSGFTSGSVKMIDYLGDYEVLLNQFQILSYLQKLHSLNKNREISFNKTNRSNPSTRLIGNGYRLHGPLNSKVMDIISSETCQIDNFAKFFAYLNKNFWTLSMLEDQIRKRSFEFNTDCTNFSCILTHVGELVPSVPKRLARAYVTELDIETYILIEHDRSICIGEELDCDKVLYIDPIGGQCVLGAVSTI